MRKVSIDGYEVDAAAPSNRMICLPSVLSTPVCSVRPLSSEVTLFGHMIYLPSILNLNSKLIGAIGLISICPIVKMDKK